MKTQYFLSEVKCPLPHSPEKAVMLHFLLLRLITPAVNIYCFFVMICDDSVLKNKNTENCDICCIFWLNLGKRHGQILFII